jgi:hypothetical protein
MKMLNHFNESSHDEATAGADACWSTVVHRISSNFFLQRSFKWPR